MKNAIFQLCLNKHLSLDGTYTLFWSRPGLFISTLRRPMSFLMDVFANYAWMRNLKCFALTPSVQILYINN